MDTAGQIKDKVNIICLFWVGDFRGRNFIVEDIRRLYACVEKHIDRPFDFYCLSNIVLPTMPGIVIPLKYNWPGWWAKMELHRPDLLDGRTLYLDLDSHVIRSLQPILDYSGDLVMFRTTRPGPPIIEKGKKLIIPRYQAATMLFDPGAMEDLYNRFLENPKKRIKKYRSDQDFMGRYIPDQPTFPDEWMIKLRQCVRDRVVPPEDVIIITGQPKGNLFRTYHEKIPWLEEMARG